MNNAMSSKNSEKIQKNILFTWMEEEKGEKENQKNW